MIGIPVISGCAARWATMPSRSFRYPVSSPGTMTRPMSLRRGLVVERVDEAVEAVAPRRVAEVREPGLGDGLLHQFVGVHGGAPYRSGRRGVRDPRGMTVEDCESKAAFVDLLATIGEVADRYAGEEWMIFGPEDTAGALRALAHLIEGGFVGHFEGTPEAPVWRADRDVDPQGAGRQRRRDLLRHPGLRRAHVPRHRQPRRRGLHVVHDRGGRRDGGFPDRTGGVLNDVDFDVAPDGSYEIFLGGEPRDRNWMPLTATRRAHHHAALLRGAGRPRPRCRCATRS